MDAGYASAAANMYSTMPVKGNGLSEFRIMDQQPLTESMKVPREKKRAREIRVRMS